MAAIALIAVFLFCVFGFLAAGEPGASPAWKIGYALAGLGSLAGAVCAARKRSRK